MLSKAMLTIVCTLLSIKGVLSSTVALDARQLNGLTTGGCYSDPDANFRTLMYSGGTDTAMTPSKCNDLCGRKYRYVGVENGNQCWCDYTIKNYGGGAKVEDPKCDMTCDGAPAGSSLRCGGNGTLSIYINGSVQEPTNKPLVVVTVNGTSTTWLYQDCYQDLRGDVRAMTIRVDPAQGVTVETCTATCGSMGYKMAGMEYGKECWCGDDLAYKVTSAQDPKLQCKQACDKDATEFCGYNKQLTMYAKRLDVKG